VFTDNPLDEGGAQLCPCGIATTTPQHFTVASRANCHMPTREFPISTISRDGCAPHPAHIRQIGAGDPLRDVITLVPRVLLFVTLAEPTPSGSTGMSRLCQGCSHPPRHLPDQAALSYTALLRQDGDGGLSPPFELSTPHGARSTWVTLQLAQRTRRGRSHTRPLPEERSERVRAKPQRRNRPGQSGHLSSGPPRLACAWSSTKSTADSFWHRPILPTGPPAGKGPVVLNPGASDGRNASHRTTWIKSARTPRNCAHHAVDAMDSSRPRIETSQPSSPTGTPGGIHVVIQSVALHSSEKSSLASDPQPDDPPLGGNFYARPTPLAVPPSGRWTVDKIRPQLPELSASADPSIGSQP
jgi:hypothetical protein